MPSGIDLLNNVQPEEPAPVSGASLIGNAGLPKTPYDDLMTKASEEHGVPYDVLYRNLRQESKFNPKAVSKTGARGVAQFMPETAKDMGVDDPHDPVQAIPGSAKYLKQLYDEFGDWKLAVAAYNAGPRRVRKAGNKIPNIAETQNHVEMVFKGYDPGAPITPKGAPVEEEGEVVTSGLSLLNATPKVVPFDPEGSGYDMETALKYGMKPDPKTGHWSSREPTTGMLLKGKKHETWSLLEEGEKKAGYEIYQKDGRYYSRKKVESSPKEFYTRTSASPYGVIHPAISAKMGMAGFGPKPDGGWDELNRPLDANGVPYNNEGIEKDKLGNPIAETLKGLTGFAAHPMEVVRGGLDFALSLPGFGVGLLGAAGRGGKTLVDQLAYGKVDLDKVYEAMSVGMKESFEFFEPGKKLITGEPTKVSQMVGEVAMAPLNVISATGQKVAAYEGFKDYPNIRGAAKITGDVVALMSMGFILHGPGRRGEFAKGAEEITKEAGEIAAKEFDLNQSTDTIVKNVQGRALQVQKEMLERKAAEFAKKFNDDLIMTEEMGRQAEQLAKEKIRPEVESPQMVKLFKRLEKDEAKTKVEELKKEAEGQPEVGKVVTDPETGKKTFKIEEKEVERRSNKYVPASSKKTVETFPPGKETDSLVNRYRMEDNLHVDESGNYKLATHKEAAAIAKEKGGTVIPTSDGKFAVALEPQSRVVFEQKALKTESDRLGKKDEAQELKKTGTDKKSQTGLPEAFKGLASGASDNFYTQAFAALGGEKNAIYKAKDPIIVAAREAYDKGEIKSPSDLKKWTEENYFNKKPKPTPVVEVKKRKKDEVKGTILHRRGRAEGKWWSDSEEYTRGMGSGRIQNVADLDLTQMKIFEGDIRTLLTPEELKIIEENPTWQSNSNPRLAESAYDAALNRAGYDGFKMLDESGETGKVHNTYYFSQNPIRKKKVAKPKVEEPKAETPKVEEPEAEAEETLSPEAQRRLDQMIEEDETGTYSDIDYGVGKRVDPEPVKQVDKATGEKPVEVIESDSVFAQDKEKTETLAKIYDERRAAVESDPEVYVQKLINDLNRIRHGEKLDKVAISNKLSEMAARADELRDFFMTGADHLQFTEVVREAAKWARELGVPKSDVTTRLNTMIPIDQVNPYIQLAIKSIFQDIKNLKFNTLYRNKDLWKQTGFWMGRDGKWRYEINDTKAKMLIDDPVLAGGKKLGEVYDNPELYARFPELKNLDVKLLDNKGSTTSGSWMADENAIYISKYIGEQYGKPWKVVNAIKHTIIHETQHYVNERLGAFEGSNVNAEAAGIIADRLRYIKREVKSDYGKFIIDGMISTLETRQNPKYFNERALGMLKINKDSIGITDSHISALEKPIKGYDRYRRVPGEMEARLSSHRMGLDKDRYEIPPWETLDRMLIDEGIPKEVGNKLYSGDPVIERATELLTKGAIKAYHWSKSKLSGDYDFGRLGETTKGNNPQAVESAKLGAWFTESDKPIAEGLKERNEVRLTLENPLVLDNKSVPEIDVMGDKIRDAKQWLMDEVERAGGGEKYKEELKKQGYDGIVLEDSEFGNKKSYVVFDKGQISTGSKLYSGDPAIEAAARAIIAGAKKVAEYTNKARGMKAFKPMEAARLIREEFNRAFIDRSGNIRNELLDKLGDDGAEVVRKMVLSKGASARSAAMLKQMGAEVYEGLSRHEKKVLDDIILDDRMVDIAKYKSPMEFKFPKGITVDDFIAHRELFPKIEGLTPERASLLDARAKAYFEWMKKPLQDMLEAGLIDQKEYDALASHNYRRIKLVEIYDKKRPGVGTSKKTVYDSGVEALSRGRDTDIYEPSSEIMALEVFNRAYGRIMNNEANKALLDLAKKDPSNEFARIKNKDVKIPPGWNRIFAYENGERQSIFINPEMAKEWINSSPEMSYRLSQLIRWSSGSVVTRTFATGIEWGFALANLPRDMMHLWFTARTFEGDKGWKPIYNPNIPVFGLQIGRDIAAVFSDAAGKKGRYNDYIKEGGGMEFLVHQGRLFQRGRHIDSTMDKIYSFLGYFGETSEVMTRLAIRERVIRRKAKEQGITMEEARKNKDITSEATFTARDYMDFGQGGGIAKAADNGLPYLNATIQGTRGLVRSLKPGSGSALSSTYKLAQLATLTTGVYIAAKASSPKTMEALTGDVAMQNNLCVPLDDSFGFEDEQGQVRYPYLKIPLDPGQKFFKTFFEASADKWLGNEVDVDRVTGSLSQLSPVGLSSLPPTIAGVVGYATNKDFWLNEDIWRRTDKPFSYPNSKEEFTNRTPQAYKDIGAVTGLSPERTKYALEQLVTRGSMWSYLVNQGYDKAFGDITKERKEQHLAMVLSEIPGIKRFFGVTKPYSKYATKIDDAEEDSTIKKFIENRGMDTLVDSYLYGKNTSRNEVIKYASSFKDLDTYERLMERFQWEEAIKNLPEKSFWRRMKGLAVDAKARVFVDRLNSSTDEQKQQLWREFGIVGSAGDVISDSFIEEVTKLRSKER